MKLLRPLRFALLALVAIAAVVVPTIFVESAVTIILDPLDFVLDAGMTDALLLMAIVALLIAVLAVGITSISRKDDASFPQWFIANPSTAPPP
ncbi:MAG: hypothetical protein M9905_17530 [Rhizobiaceae bacterium]|nr:hypothetical protein [Rhizobiaceae bacterium]